jgi:hypothetical protein
MYNWLDFSKSAYAICPDKFCLVRDLGYSICSYPSWVGSMECSYALCCGCGLVGCVSEADCQFLFLYRSYFDSLPIPTTIVSILLLKTLSLHSPSSRRQSHNPNKQVLAVYNFWISLWTRHQCIYLPSLSFLSF